MDDLSGPVAKSVKHFWTTRGRQARSQGSKTGQKNTGARSAVTGGRQLDGFVALCKDLLIEAGLAEADVHWKAKLDIPGYFRPEKKWDLLAVVDNELLAIIEFKSQVGSFGNNFNNRTEESLGNATDLWAAYREGAYAPSKRPWLGYLFLLEKCERSLAPVNVRESHFAVFDEFREASYAKRYEILLTKLLRERLYDGACLLLSDKKTGMRGKYDEPNKELRFQNFATSLTAHAMAFAKTREN